MQTHRIPASDFESVAAGGADESGVLRAGQLSKRRLLLATVLKKLEAQDPAQFEAGQFAQSWTTLACAAELDAAAANDVLLYPAVGAWGMNYLRSLQGVESRWNAEDDPGYFGGLVAVAALRVGLSAEVAVRVRTDGTVVFPSLGVLPSLGEPRWVTARVRPELDAVELTEHGRRFAVAPTADALWWPLRRLRSSVAGQSIELLLDDVDPFRAPDDVLPASRMDEEAATWQLHLDTAWELLIQHHPGRAVAIADGVASLTPLRATEAESELNSSSGDSFGGISLTPPRDAHGLATALVHEHQHLKLSALLDLIPLVEPSPGSLLYAPWRIDPRPAGGLLQGAYAHLGLVQFWQRERFRLRDAEGRTAHFEFARWRHGVDSALGSLAGSGQLTEAGERFVQQMRQALSPLLAEWVPALPLALAREALDEHWFVWRLKNLRPDAGHIKAQALAFRAGEPFQFTGAPPPLPMPGKREAWTSGRQMLAQSRLASPSGTLDLGGFGKVEAGDLAFSLRNYAAAAEHYADAIQAHDSHDAWTGFILAHRHLDSPATPALVRCPETVRGLHRLLGVETARRPAPEAVAAWISAALRERG